MAIYHTPLYTTLKSKKGSNELFMQETWEQGFKNWIHIFDKHKFLVSFENHEHNFKRTKPLINNTYNECGTTYLG